MEYEKIKQLIEDVGNSKLSEIEIDFPDGTKISMKKEEKVVVATPKIVEENKETVVQTVEKQEEKVINEAQENNNQAEGKIVTSPIAWVEEAQAVTIEIDSPFSPKSIVILPAGIFAIDIGINIGETLPCPLVT